MLSIVATTVIAISGIIVSFHDNCEVTLGLSFLVFFCAMVIARDSSCIHEIPKLEALKVVSSIGVVLVIFQSCISSFRVRKYLDHGKRVAPVICIAFLVAALTLIYTVHSIKSTLKRMKEEKLTEKSSRKSTGTSQAKSTGESSGEQSKRVWV